MSIDDEPTDEWGEFFEALNSQYPLGAGLKDHVCDRAAEMWRDLDPVDGHPTSVDINIDEEGVYATMSGFVFISAFCDVLTRRILGAAFDDEVIETLAQRVADEISPTPETRMRPSQQCDNCGKEADPVFEFCPYCGDEY